MTMIAEAIFQLPPFPEATRTDLVSAGHSCSDEASAALLLAAMRDRRVGGKFWLSGDAAEIDPWSQRDGVNSYSAEEPHALLDAIVGRPVHVQGEGLFSCLSNLSPGALETETVIRALICRHLLSGVIYHSPFTGEPIDPLQLVDILGAWRDLIDLNRPIMAAFGFAPWKQETICPLLWGGRTVPFLPARDSILTSLPDSASIAVWKARVPAPF